ncbi:DNA polymerase [[Ruminococcus] torques]|uniref:DNA polymerase n=1 Tax=[Ruminococcus] torques TaxID=33039 RepID=UPI0035223F60
MGRTLAIDIETYSDVDLISCGVYKYSSSPYFEILLIAYSVDDKETVCIDVANGEEPPKEFMEMLFDDTVTKTAFNANFERTCFSNYYQHSFRPEAWRCTAVQATMLALPLSLEGVGAVLGLDKQKMTEGKELIKYFCSPCKATKSNGGRTRNLPKDAPEKWRQFKTYCIRDVDVEKQIRQRLAKFPIPKREQEIYCLDQRINDRGIMVDRNLVNHAVACDLLYKETATARAYELTGLENPNSVSQLKLWLKEKGLEVDSLAKDTVKDLSMKAEGDVQEVLKLRLATSKTSVKKYEAIDRSVCAENRVHGLLQFYGANRTGRWAGRLVQIHNLPQNHLPDLELARALVSEGRYEEVELFYESTPNVLSELIRTAFVAKPGCRFIISDYSAIEARVLAWLAGEEWRLQVFETHGKIYEASASAMFHVPIEEITKTSPLRQKGKISELALGYGGAVGALTSMGALKMGLTEEELPGLVSTWRSANPHITAFWWAVDEAAITAVRDKKLSKVGRVSFEYKSGILFVTLPSGRKLSYVKPRMMMNKFGREGLTYEGIGESKKWMRLETYGPKLVENIVQAASRDILAEAMLRLEKEGFDIVCHVHDEVVLEVPDGKSSVEEVNEIMAVNPVWTEGLPLKAAGFESPFYKKD